MSWSQSVPQVPETAPANAEVPAANLYKLAACIASQKHADSIVVQISVLCRKVGFHDSGETHEET